MPNYFYYDQNGTRRGPINDQQLHTLAMQGMITPKTALETEGGHKGVAGQIPGLNFGVAAGTTPLHAGASPQDPFTGKAVAPAIKIGVGGIRSWLLDFAFHDIRLPVINLWVCRVTYAIGCILAAIFFVGGNGLAFYAFLEHLRGTGPGDIEAFIFACMFVSWLIAPLMVCATRVACEWEIMMFDWIVETTNAARMFVEKNSEK